jgi:hypothetical protein
MNRKNAVLAVLGLAAVVLAAHALYAAYGEPGPPCDIDPNIHCLDYVDPVECIKPGEGWKTYSNACYAFKDCVIGATCRSTGG